MSAHTEPELRADPALAGVLAELEKLEPIFHRPEHGTDFDNMMVEDFWEVGASGQRYSRQYALQVLDERKAHPSPDVWETSGFHCRKLCRDVYLLTYSLLQDGVRKTRRSTIWQRTTMGWKIVFHQGTLYNDQTG